MLDILYLLNLVKYIKISIILRISSYLIVCGGRKMDNSYIDWMWGKKDGQ